MSGQYSGYHDCPCRDCFEIAIGSLWNEEEQRYDDKPALCHECESAGCDHTGESECSVERFDGDDEPQDGDLVTEDHTEFYQVGRMGLVLRVEDGECWQTRVRQWMDRERYWPNCYFISDHGNAHLITFGDDK